MIDSEHHIKLNGTKYRLAEDAEGEHYVGDTPTLRAPNSGVVQGGDPQEVNLDPETLLWKIDSWNEGEAQIKFDPAQPGRSEAIQGVNWFGRPGNLFLGYEPNLTLNSVGATFGGEGGLVVARNELYHVGIGSGNDDYRAWDGPTDWAASASIGSTDGARNARSIVGDGNYIFFVKHNSAELWRWDGTTWANHNDQAESKGSQLAHLGAYVYKYNQDGKVYELSKATANTTTAETPILDFSDEGNVQRWTERKITAGDNRVYVMATYKYETVIYEIVPTTAAQTGYGRELLRIQGMRGESLAFHAGFLYWTGIDNEADGSVGARRVIYYYQPGASWGTLGELRSYYLDQRIPGGEYQLGSGRLNTLALIGPATLSGTNKEAAEIDMWEIDAVSGGYGVTGRGQALSLGEHFVCTSTVFFEGKVFATLQDRAAGTTDRTIFWDTTEYDVSGYAISPSHDFGIASSKVLHSIETVLDPLPANTEVRIAYSLDGGSWTNLTNNTTDGSTGTLEVISTDSSVKTFREMRIRVSLVGTASNTPIVKAVNVRASADSTFQTWQLLVDATDETGPRGHSGAQILSDLKSLSNTVVAFQDGYLDRRPNQYTEYDVVVQRVTPVVSSPGEGIVQVLLKEVT